MIIVSCLKVALYVQCTMCPNNALYVQCAAVVRGYMDTAAELQVESTQSAADALLTFNASTPDRGRTTSPRQIAPPRLRGCYVAVEEGQTGCV